MKLEEIGFYTLSDKRAMSACATSPLSRCELVLTARCNFKCPYCRSIGGSDLPYAEAKATVSQWAFDGLKNIRFSGGEPTLYKGLDRLCSFARARGVERIAVSTNGSASKDIYRGLIAAGVNDFSVSLDACCAEDGDLMAGGVKGAWNKVRDNIRWLAARVYVTVGVVLTEENAGEINDIVSFADSLGVSDIRVIPAAQNGNRLSSIEVDEELLEKYPILDYRIKNVQNGCRVRGMRPGDSTKCGLALDDMAVNQGKHYPCIIYMRESGAAIGQFGLDVRQQRQDWYDTHNTHEDLICSTNCLDVCVDYNNRFAELSNVNPLTQK